MFPIHVRVSDASGPIRARLRLTDAEGRFRPLFGGEGPIPVAPGEDVGGRVVLAGRAYSYIDGDAEASLPRGPGVRAIASKGPEWVPFDGPAERSPNQLSLRLTLRRLVDLRAEGWYAGDMRAHALSAHAAALEGAAEGLAIVQLLRRERPISLLSDFSGTAAALDDGECAVVVNTLNEHPVLGSLSLLHAHRLIHPLASGREADDWSVFDWANQCKRKGGLVVWPDLPNRATQGEALAAALLGKVDAYEVADVTSPDCLEMYYRLLSLALRIALVGASGKDSNAVPLGAIRTYARVDGPMTPASWVEAVRAGRTFATTGPLLTLGVEGDRLRAVARSHAPVECVEIVANGEARASGAPSAEWRWDGRPAWVAARCRPWAHTSPVWLGAPTIRPGSAAFAEVLREARAWAATARCDDRHREYLGKVLNDALAVATPGG